MSSSPDRSGEATVLEMLESVVLLITGAVVAAPMLPGFTLCIPVLVAVTIAVVAPLVAVAAVAAVLGAIVMIPYLLVRSAAGGLRSRRAAGMPVPARVPAAEM